ncbi:sulfur carrier protein ThiS [Shewanella algae]|uniref:sulfur carrier protein ThiS n=1 Tax=Shewanella algae TaxID=38313 RepID=UPI001AACE5F3|nr:sulfur carrier protein ThiS [Shewanella algae]MBO2600691.1 sulfur carrier protein ThiS [Shewanella algae]
MQIKINNQVKELPEAMTLSQLLEWCEIAPGSVALVRNGAVVPRSQWPMLECQNGDCLELFSAVAGG